MALPIDGGHEVHDAGKPEFYDAYRNHFGRLLLRPALAERTAAQHGAVLCSNVSPGAAYFHDAARHGELHHRELSYRPGGAPMGETVAAPPGSVGDAVMAKRFVNVLLERPPSVATLWLSDPDKTMHAFPLGSDEHLQAVREADAHVGAVAQAVDRLRDRGHDVLLFVGSDHGHEAVTETIPVERRLFEAGLQARAGKPGACRCAVGLIGPHPFRRRRACRAATRSPPGSPSNPGPGASSRARTSPNSARRRRPTCSRSTWQRRGRNRNGVPGLTGYAVRFSEDEDEVRRDCGMHGGLGRYETNPTLIAVGQGFAAGGVMTRTTAHHRSRAIGAETSRTAARTARWDAAAGLQPEYPVRTRGHHFLNSIRNGSQPRSVADRVEPGARRCGPLFLFVCLVDRPASPRRGRATTSPPRRPSSARKSRPLRTTTPRRPIPMLRRRSMRCFRTPTSSWRWSAAAMRRFIATRASSSASAAPTTARSRRPCASSTPTATRGTRSILWSSKPDGSWKITGCVLKPVGQSA